MGSSQLLFGGLVEWLDSRDATLDTDVRIVYPPPHTHMNKHKYCPDCGKPKSHHKYTRCQKCWSIFSVGENSNRWEGGSSKEERNKYLRAWRLCNGVTKAHRGSKPKPEDTSTVKKLKHEEIHSYTDYWLSRIA